MDEIIEAFFNLLEFDVYEVKFNRLVQNCIFYEFLVKRVNRLISSNEFIESIKNHLNLLMDSANIFEKGSIIRLKMLINKQLKFKPNYNKLNSKLDEKQVQMIYQLFINKIFAEGTEYEDFLNLFQGNIYLMARTNIVIKNKKLCDFVYLLDEVFNHNVNYSKLCHYKFIFHTNGSIISENNICKARKYAVDEKLSFEYIDKGLKEIFSIESNFL